jgi:hypothetical protein
MAQAARQALVTRLEALVSGSTKMASKLPVVIREAEAALDAAEREFEEGAFAPFWDCVEKATERLATFQFVVQDITRIAKEYREESAALGSETVPFAIGLKRLPDATPCARRMQAIVRAAQKTFQFATIYEQRRTNQVLVTGFSTLANALQDLGDRLEYSTATLDATLRSATSDVMSTQRETAEELAGEIRSFQDQTAGHALRTREHESREEEMLDNIQRRRKPSS